MRPDLTLVKKGSVVQLSPILDEEGFAYCLMVVTEVKFTSVTGYVQDVGPYQGYGKQCFYRAKWEDIEYVGESFWLVE